MVDYSVKSYRESHRSYKVSCLSFSCAFKKEPKATIPGCVLASSAYKMCTPNSCPAFEAATAAAKSGSCTTLQIVTPPPHWVANTLSKVVFAPSSHCSANSMVNCRRHVLLRWRSLSRPSCLLLLLYNLSFLPGGQMARSKVQSFTADLLKHPFVTAAILHLQEFSCPVAQFLAR